MPKTIRTSASVRRKYSAEESGWEPGHPDDGRLDWKEKTAAVCELFCKGKTVREIVQLMGELYGAAGAMKREEPYSILSRAASKGWLRFDPPRHVLYESKVKNRYPWLHDVQVVHTASVRHVAQQTAEVVLKLMRQFARGTRKKTLHLGFAGGFAMSKFARELARLLEREEERTLPPSVVFHSLVAGFDPRDPSTDPNTFFSFFLDEASIRIEPQFLGLHAPALVFTKDIPNLRKLPEIDEAYRGAKMLDIIVTSGADWKHEHSMLHRYMKRSKESIKVLDSRGCRGDLLWRPIGDSGPIEDETEIRAMTVIELSEIPDFIQRGTHVVLMFGPCGGCRKPKGPILRTILDQKERYLTHLVTDSRSIVELVRDEEEEPRAG